MILRHPFFRLSLLAAFFFLLGFSYSYHLPKLESLMLMEVERLSRQHSPVRIWAQNLHLHLLPLGIVMEDVRLLPQPPLDKTLAPARLREAGARLAFWPLLRGEIRLSSVFVRHSEFNLFLRNDQLAKGSGDGIRFSFDDVYRLPVDEISLEHVQLQGRLDPQNVVFRISDLNLIIENRYRSLFVEFTAPSVQMKPSGPLPALNAQLELRTLVEASEVQVSALKMKLDDSFVVASGRFNGDIAAGRIENGSFDARAKILLPDVNTWERALLVKSKLPVLAGRAEVDLGVEVRKGKGARFETDVKAEGLQVNEYIIGGVHGHLASDLKTLTSDDLTFSSNAGKVRLRKLKVNLDEKAPSISGAVNVDHLEVRQLLKNLDVHRVPIQVPLRGDADCSGVWVPKPELNCKGKLHALRIWVYDDSGKTRDTIVDALDARVDGEVKVTAKDVQYKAEAALGAKSKGRSRGTIDYEKGFKIFYEGDHLDFADIRSLSNLKLEGEARVDGSTEGTSDWGTLSMNVDGKELWLEDYPLGRASAKVTYKAGRLGFSALQGQYGVSQYNGQVEVDLPHRRIRIGANLPFADLQDLQQLFQRKVSLPFQVAGTGQGQLEAQGPLNFPDMSYKLRSSFFRGEIAGETFDELVFNVSSVDGLVKTDRVTLSKSSGVAETKGQITPKGEIDAVVVGRGMRLEQSENVLRYGLDLQGMADFTVLIRGQLPRPRIELNGRLSRMVLADQPAEDSVFKLNFLSDRMEGSGQFLGSTLLAQATYPYSDDAPFDLQLKTRSWDFTSLFSLISRSARQLDFSTSVTASLNLASPRGGFWASTGQLEVNEFLMRKGSKVMSAPRPMYLIMRSGEVNSNGFALTSGDSYLKLDVAGMTRDHLNASLNGKLDMSLLGLFTPFISDLRGNMSLTVDLSGTVAKPAISGSAYVDRGYIKLAEFIHPFLNIRADVLFNDNQILLNSVKSEMAGGRLSADGKITFSGGQRIVDIKGGLTDVKMNIPEGFRTQGSGTVAINGNAFPYNMNIGYTVTGGEVVYEFGEPAGGTSSVTASAYLPRFLYQEAFHPFTFNVDVQLKNPVAINNALAKAQVSGRIAATGTPDRLLLTGMLTPAPGGKVFFKDEPFEISSGYVEYNGNPPQNPKVYLTANTRVTDRGQDDNQRTTEKQYDVNLLVQGRGPVPQIILSSQPPLNQREIVSLLTLGVTTGNLEERRSNDFQAANTSTALGAALLQKAGSKRLRESFGLDMKVTNSQPTPDTASPKVTFSKQFTPNLSASASSTVQANPTNSARLEYKMNKSMSAIGSWEGRQYGREQTNPTTNVLGLDLEFKKQFK